jgi:hypothetical protein
VIKRNGHLILQDGTRIPFTSWAPVVGDIVADVMLVESGSGPQLLPLSAANTLEIIGQDKEAFFWQYLVRLNPPVEKRGEFYVALTYVLLCSDQGILRIAAEDVRSISCGS